MSKSLKEINQGDLFNDIHYMNYTNINIIQFFTEKVKTQAKEYASIHSYLKEEGNKIKDIEKDLDKRLKKPLFSIQEICLEESKEIESDFKLLSTSIYQIRESIKRSFETFINQLCTFAETKDTLQELLLQGQQSYNDASPIISKKLNALKGKPVIMKDKNQFINISHKSEEKSNNALPPRFNTSGLGDLVNQKEKSRNNFFSTEKKIRGRVYQSMVYENPEKESYDIYNNNNSIFHKISSNVLMLSPNSNEIKGNNTLLNQTNTQLINIAQRDSDENSDDQDQ